MNACGSRTAAINIDGDRGWLGGATVWSQMGAAVQADQTWDSQERERESDDANVEAAAAETAAR